MNIRIFWNSCAIFSLFRILICQIWMLFFFPPPPVRVDCTQADMLITLLFGTPFEGRVYSTGNPQACFEMGSGQSQIVLRIPMGTQCGTVQQVRVLYWQWPEVFVVTKGHRVWGQSNVWQGFRLRQSCPMSSNTSSYSTFSIVE